MDPKRILVAPVSGGAFPYQLGLIRELLLSGSPKHDIMLGTSGGNVVCQLLNAAKYDLSTFDKLIKLIEGHLVAKEWNQALKFIPGPIWAAIKGSAYQPSLDGVKLLENVYTHSDPTYTEMWMTTMDITKHKVQLWCNRDRSQFDFSSFDHTEVRCLRPKYLDGDVTKMALVSIASASLPLFVSGIDIDNHQHRDGGIAYSSPLTPLRDVIVASFPQYHIDYISSYDIEDSGNRDYTNIAADGTSTLQDLLQSLNYSDRKVGLDLLRDGLANPIHQEGVCSTESLVHIESLRKTYKRSVLELYPRKTGLINIVDVDNDEVRSHMKRAQKYASYRLWLSN